MMSKELPFIDQVNIEIDSRKIDALVADGTLSLEDIVNAPVYHISCPNGCTEGMDGNSPLRCLKCGSEGQEELIEL